MAIDQEPSDPPSHCLSTHPSLRQNFIQADSKTLNSTVHAVTLSSPSPMLSCVEKAPKSSQVSLIPGTASDVQPSNRTVALNSLQDVHISARLMEDFLELARENTDKDLETCGILCAFLCEAIREEEFFAIQNERSLFPVGWIHTHPSQNCFMSSIDLHTHYSYQAMVPEAFAIVIAPTDTSRGYGIYRLTDPGGMAVLQECKEAGFHPHREPNDGGPIYEHCSNVYTNDNLRFEIFDLR
ncbi:AMSH-like ubiquitin thioesterase 2 [Turnera subulata]|uniref:AMSH-like ubiquitin thioesterase 2 n=1 Tax=Turnera subulata TaxID=218843 RepID=A0A9Q0G3L7_9ROSI|nr:AMSH-like ubiquitin thioesterase 2 [Turnera subulata]